MSVIRMLIVLDIVGNDHGIPGSDNDGSDGGGDDSGDFGCRGSCGGDWQ